MSSPPQLAQRFVEGAPAHPSQRVQPAVRAAAGSRQATIGGNDPEQLSRITDRAAVTSASWRSKNAVASKRRSYLPRESPSSKGTTAVFATSMWSRLA